MPSSFCTQPQTYSISPNSFVSHYHTSPASTAAGIGLELDCEVREVWLEISHISIHPTAPFLSFILFMFDLHTFPYSQALNLWFKPTLFSHSSLTYSAQRSPAPTLFQHPHPIPYHTPFHTLPYSIPHLNSTPYHTPFYTYHTPFHTLPFLILHLLYSLPHLTILHSLSYYSSPHLTIL